MKSRVWFPSSKTRGKDRSDSGVGIGERLTLAVDVEEPQCNRRHSVGGADREHHLLVVPLSDRVDGGRPQQLRLCGRLRLERRAVVCEHLPLARSELALGPHTGRQPRLARLRVAVLALAVDRHRRGDQQLADLVTALERFLQ
jgi:hypothetical protein